MSKVIPSFTLALAVFSSQLFAADKYQLEPNLSSVSFATIKNQFVVEPATVGGLQGEIDESGQFQLSADLTSISTAVPIRDTRLNELYFESANHPVIKVSGSVDWNALSSGPKNMVVPAEVSMFGNSKRIDFPVVMVQAGDYLTVSSVSPVIVNGGDFGIPAENLAKLAETVGGIPISPQVPLSITLTFKK